MQLDVGSVHFDLLHFPFFAPTRLLYVNAMSTRIGPSQLRV
jgi:hypothetical protein